MFKYFHLFSLSRVDTEGVVLSKTEYIVVEAEKSVAHSYPPCAAGASRLKLGNMSGRNQGLFPSQACCEARLVFRESIEESVRFLPVRVYIYRGE